MIIVKSSLGVQIETMKNPFNRTGCIKSFSKDSVQAWMWLCRWPSRILCVSQRAADQGDLGVRMLGFVVTLLIH